MRDSSTWLECAAENKLTWKTSNADTTITPMTAGNNNCQGRPSDTQGTSAPGVSCSGTESIEKRLFGATTCEQPYLRILIR
jgi:hypothetical protein